MTERQAAFVRHYAAGADGVAGNATAAYRAAGYRARGHAAESAGARLLRNVEVAAEIDQLRGDARERAVVALLPWAQLVPAAQQTLVLAMRGELRGNPMAQIKAASYILDRALGKPVAATQIRFPGGSIDDALDALDQKPTLVVRFVLPRAVQKPDDALDASVSRDRLRAS